ncbi:MAG: hypothetical protein UX15_C0006G0016 [Parcubacteria group bacterium GW2011_GWA1_45_7]|nr:MAG: hypothetical protein UX15_C0006G0016 [Parcubacteria group bacterium GW2011_GWA1_45_7]
MGLDEADFWICPDCQARNYKKSVCMCGYNPNAASPNPQAPSEPIVPGSVHLKEEEMCEQGLTWTCPLCGANNYGDTGAQPCWQCHDDTRVARRIVAETKAAKKAQIAESPAPHHQWEEHIPSHPR